MEVDLTSTLLSKITYFPGNGGNDFVQVRDGWEKMERNRRNGQIRQLLVDEREKIN